MMQILSLFSYINDFIKSYTKNNKILVLLVLSIIFSGCTGDRCIDADDFGFIKLTVSARYNQDELTSQQHDNQIAPWRDSGFVVNGRPLTIMVRSWNKASYDNSADELSAWCAWYGSADNKDTLSSFCEKLQECTFNAGLMCTPTKKDAQINNAPCIFTKGVGLYGLIADKSDANPNLSFATQQSPNGITFHIGEKLIGYELYDIDKNGAPVRAGGIDYKYDNGDDLTYANSPLYFKILDKFYDDNNGQYKLVIKSGVLDSRPDPLQFLEKLIKDQFFGTDGLVSQIYLKITTENVGYRLAVSALLTLYVMFTAFSFLIGNLNITHTELMVRIFKISLVSTLLSSSYSWTFFNDYLFSYFVGGVAQLIQMINAAATTGTGSTTIIGLMIAPQTIAKLFSLLFVQWTGIIYIILFLIALYFVFMMVFQATIIYLTALITIGTIIIMGPIFICFMLFNITRSLFENWLKQLISYSLQPLILFTGLAFTSEIIRDEIYASLGFAVCKHDFPNLGPMNTILGSFAQKLDPSLGNSLFYWWFPVGITKGFTIDEKTNMPVKANIPVPLDHWVSKDKLCVAFECMEERYIQLPFLKPVTDDDRVRKFMNGNFVQFDGLWLIFIAVYLLSKFNGLSISIARFISSTSGNLTSLQKAGQAAFEPIKAQMDRPLNAAYDGVSKAVSSVPRRMRGWADKNLTKGSLLHTITHVASDPLGAAGQGYEQFQFNRLRNQALSDSANQSVLDEVQRTYGIDKKDVNVDAKKNYKEGLAKALKELKPGMSDDELKAQVQKFSKADNDGLKDNLAEMQYGKGKTFDSLSKDEKSKIDDSMKKYSLRELSTDAKFTRDFRNAYVASHQALSKRGVGLFGKNIKGLRELEELKHNIDEKRQLKMKKRWNRGERIYAGYEQAKRTVLTAIVGENLRDSLEGSMTGAAWHDFERSDPRLRTYSEILEDQKRSLEYEKLQKRINRETVNNSHDVLSPEYLARLGMNGGIDDVNYYDALSRAKLSHEVYAKLADGEDPAIMGDKFLREKATDSQSQHMINRAYEIQEEMIANDKYIRRQDHYEILHEKAIENIKLVHKGLALYYKRDDIKAEEMPDLLDRYHNQPDPEDLFGGASFENLKKSFEEFDYTKNVLEKIDERRTNIIEEVAGHIAEINEQREASGMHKYKKPVVPQVRRLRSMEDHLPRPRDE